MHIAAFHPKYRQDTFTLPLRESSKIYLVGNSLKQRRVTFQTHRIKGGANSRVLG